MTRDSRAALALLGVLLGLVAIVTPELGSDAWATRSAPDVRAHGLLGPLVRAAHGRFDLGLPRTAAVLCGLLVLAAVPFVLDRGRPRLLLAVTICVCAGLVLPATALQVGLRDASRPWYFTNDATYQIELAGDGILHGHDPYGRDWRGSGLDRFYAETPKADPTRVALDHFAYFPGTPELGAAWRVLPAPLDDIRVLMALLTLGAIGAALLLPGPYELRLAIGAALAANPLAVRGAWFGVADAPVVLALVLVFAALSRRRFALAGVALGAAILLKQFGLAALPFAAAGALVLAGRRELRRLLGACAATVLVGVLPFLVAGPQALYDDTIAFGTGTYRIVGYGLSALLLRLHVIGNRTGAYPFAPIAVVVWLPLTVYAVRLALARRSLALCAAGLAASFYVLFFIARVFQTTYLVYPLAAALVAVALAAQERGTSA